VLWLGEGHLLVPFHSYLGMSLVGHEGIILISKTTFRHEVWWADVVSVACGLVVP
jgi:hypothetical protein